MSGSTLWLMSMFQRRSRGAPVRRYTVASGVTVRARALTTGAILSATSWCFVTSKRYPKRWVVPSFVFSTGNKFNTRRDALRVPRIATQGRRSSVASPAYHTRVSRKVWRYSPYCRSSGIARAFPIRSPTVVSFTSRGDDSDALFVLLLLWLCASHNTH